VLNLFYLELLNLKIRLVIEQRAQLLAGKKFKQIGIDH
jgi:hypothetical protein